MDILRSMTLLAALWLLAACESVQITQTLAPDTRLQSARYYSWNCAAGGTDERTRRFDAALRQAVNQELQSRGYVETVSSKADFLLDYRFGEMPRSTLEASQTPSYDGWQRGQAGMEYTGWQNPPDMHEYHAGVINLAFQHPDGSDLWVIYGEKILNHKDAIKNLEKNVTGVVKQLFRVYPLEAAH